MTTHNQPWKSWNPEKHLEEVDARKRHWDRFVDLAIEADTPILKRDLSTAKRREQEIQR